MKFWEKRIPTTFGILLLIVAVLATSYLVNTGVIFFGGATPSDNPQDVRITNITDTSFTVTYHTAAKVIGTISVGETKDALTTVLDERDQQSGIPQPYFLHSITAQKLKPQTTYIFSITSGTTTYQNNGTLFTTQTSSPITDSPTAAIPLSGTLIGTDGASPPEAFVFVTVAGGQTLSVLSKSNGIYIVPLNTIRTKEGRAYLALTPETVVQILATDGTQNSQAQIQVKGDNPVPVITLGSNYNFVVNAVPIASTAASLGFPAFPTDNTLTATPIITVPTKDEGFTDSQPQFSGKALPNQAVTIEVHSDAIVTATVTSDSAGTWRYRPATPLPVGQHILRITTRNAAGILQTIEQSFSIFANGSQVALASTLSAQLLSPTPTKILTATPSITPTTPTTTITPTPILTVTSTPTITTAAKPTPKPTLPPTGNNSLIISSGLALAASVVGVVLFIVTRGAAL